MRYKICLISVALLLALSVQTPAMSVQQAVTEKLIVLYSLDTSYTEIEILSNPLKATSVTSGDMTLKPLTQKDPSGLFTVLVQISDGERIVESGQIKLRIKRYADVLVVTDQLRRYDIITPDKVEVKRLEITNLTEQPLTDISQLDGLRLKRHLSRGTVVTTGALEPLPDVESGASTMIIYDDGLCRVTAEGTALESGLAGDYIRVKNKATNKIITARIAENGTVIIDP